MPLPGPSALPTVRVVSLLRAGWGGVGGGNGAGGKDGTVALVGKEAGGGRGAEAVDWACAHGNVFYLP